MGWTFQASTVCYCQSPRAALSPGQPSAASQPCRQEAREEDREKPKTRRRMPKTITGKGRAGPGLFFPNRALRPRQRTHLLRKGNGLLGRLQRRVGARHHWHLALLRQPPRRGLVAHGLRGGGTRGVCVCLCVGGGFKARRQGRKESSCHLLACRHPGSGKQRWPGPAARAQERMHAPMHASGFRGRQGGLPSPPPGPGARPRPSLERCPLPARSALALEK